jgi:hypothetical protein
MKSPFLLPAVTALIGFSIAWIAKPSATQAPLVAKTEKLEEKPPARSGVDSRPTGGDASRPSKPINAGEYPLADLAAEGPQTRSEAKMLRLTEVLGLSTDQQGEIISLIEKVREKSNPDLPIIEDLAVRGSEVEEGLGKLLTPEQLEKFEELRVRERENRIEVRAQTVLTQVIQDIDLAANQREQVLDRLRQKAKVDFQIIPASAAILLDQSMLPTKGKELSLEGVLLSAKFGQTNTNLDPNAAFQEVMNQRKSELEASLRCFDGILTPGQMGQYQASITEKNRTLEKVQQSIMANPKK